MTNYVFKKRWKRALAGLIDLFGYIVFSPLKIFRKKVTPAKILVVRLDQVGDLIQALPFFQKIKEKFPRAEIHALVARGTEVILWGNKNIDKIHLLQSSWFYPERKRDNAERNKLSFKIRKQKFDLAYDLRGDLRTILFLYFSGVKQICSYPSAGGGFLLDACKPYDREEHEIDKNLKLIDEKSKDEMVMEFNIPRYEKENAKRFIVGMCNDRDRKIILHPFSRASSKMWGLKRFNELIKRITGENENLKVFVIGSNVEKEFEKEIDFSENVFNCIGLFSLQGIIALILQADAFIGNDSGPQYFAAYSGIKTCVIYGYTVNYKRWKPKVAPENFIGVSIPVDCGPCELSECNNKEGHICMKLITVDSVYDIIKDWL
jgi:ADP-heptose:LPS heptosyltransferase